MDADETSRGDAVNRINLTTAVIVIAGAILIVMFVSWQWVASTKRRATVALADLESSQEIAADLARVRRAPKIASLAAESPDAIAARITHAIGVSGVMPQSIVAVDPQSPQRIGRSPYEVRLTEIAVRQETLAAIAQLAAALEDPDQGLVVRDLSIEFRDLDTSAASAPRELWDARLTLTQTIYSPISSQ